MSRIDYSKWDHIGDSSDDEEQKQEDATPRVTRLDQPSRIVTHHGQEGFDVLQPPTKETTASISRGKKESSNTTTDTSTTAVPVSSWTEKGGVAELKLQQAEESSPIIMYWTQDRYTVTLRVPVPHDRPVLNVQVKGILSYEDRNCAASTLSPPQLTVRSKAKKSVTDFNLWFQGDLPHAVHLAQEEEEIDWSIERLRGDDDDNNRYLTIILSKAVPMEGVFVWWKRPLLQCPETEWRNETDASSSFQQAWKEAHEQFQANIATREKTVI